MPTGSGHRRLACLAIVVLLGATGCGLRFLGDSQAQAIRADQRLIVSSPANFEDGRNVPRQVVCAEPSPDVASALSKSFDASGALDAVARSQSTPTEGAVKAAGAISLAHAETIAQLTNRLATVQLLRDTLYRACEAYRNGALSEITYAIMLSRFDKLMVTMLTGELVAGNFGQSLAILGGSASGTAGASPQVKQTADQAAVSQKAVADARTALDTKQAELADAQKALNACTDETCKATQQVTVATKQKEVATASSNLLTALSDAMGSVTASTSANATTLIAQGVGAVPARSQVDVQNTLRAMQQKYLENIHVDPLIVSCITAFDRDRKDGLPTSGRSAALIKFCTDTLPKVVESQHDLLRAKLVDAPSGLLGSESA